MFPVNTQLQPAYVTVGSMVPGLMTCLAKMSSRTTVQGKILVQLHSLHIV